MQNKSGGDKRPVPLSDKRIVPRLHGSDDCRRTGSEQANVFRSAPKSRHVGMLRTSTSRSARHVSVADTLAVLEPGFAEARAEIERLQEAKRRALQARR